MIQVEGLNSQCGEGWLAVQGIAWMCSGSCRPGAYTSVATPRHLEISFVTGILPRIWEIARMMNSRGTTPIW